MVPGAVILLYHRVYSPVRDPQLLCVSRANFRAHLEILKKKATLLSMPQLSRFLAAGKLPRRSVVITFDDGYRDNLEEAKPELENYEAPATFFVASGCLGMEREFWSDELERILLSPGRLPRGLELEIGGERFEDDLGDDRVYSEREADCHAGWDVTHPARPTARHRLYEALGKRLREAGRADREEALRALRAWAGEEGSGRPDYHPMTAADLVQLSRSALCEIGSHTLSHPHLASISVREQEAEIAGSKTQLEGILNRRICGFSYPYGGKADYDAQSLSSVRKAGFEWACSNFPGLARRENDRFELPRHLVRNWEGARFARFLSRWL